MKAPVRARRHGAPCARGPFRSGLVWLCAVAGAVPLALYGTRIAAEIGEPAAAGALGVGAIGSVGGFLVGLVVHRVRRQHGRREAQSLPGSPAELVAVRAELERDFLSALRVEADALGMSRDTQRRLARDLVGQLERIVSDGTADSMSAQFPVLLGGQLVAFRGRLALARLRDVAGLSGDELERRLATTLLPTFQRFQWGPAEQRVALERLMSSGPDDHTA